MCGLMAHGATKQLSTGKMVSQTTQDTVRIVFQSILLLERTVTNRAMKLSFLTRVSWQETKVLLSPFSLCRVLYVCLTDLCTIHIVINPHPPSHTHGKSLSAGIVAAIVVALLSVACGIAAAMFFVIRRRRRRDTSGEYRLMTKKVDGGDDEDEDEDEDEDDDEDEDEDDVSPLQFDS